MENRKVHAPEADTKNILGTRVISNLAVTVSTKDEYLAGTDAQVFLDLGALGSYPLMSVGKNDFKRGKSGTYLLDTPFTLAALREARIRLGHDNTGKMPGWFVSGVAIQVKFADSNTLVPYKEWGEIGWLSIEVEPFSVVAELQEGVQGTSASTPPHQNVIGSPT